MKATPHNIKTQHTLNQIGTSLTHFIHTHTHTQVDVVVRTHDNNTQVNTHNVHDPDTHHSLLAGWLLAGQAVWGKWLPSADHSLHLHPSQPFQLSPAPTQVMMLLRSAIHIRGSVLVQSPAHISQHSSPTQVTLMHTWGPTCMFLIGMLKLVPNI